MSSFSAFKIHLLIFFAATYSNIIINFAGVTGKGFGFFLSEVLAEFGLTFWLVVIVVSFVISEYFLIFLTKNIFKYSRIYISIALFLILLADVYMFFVSAQ